MVGVQDVAKDRLDEGFPGGEQPTADPVAPLPDEPIPAGPTLHQLGSESPVSLMTSTFFVFLLSFFSFFRDWRWVEIC